jgi:hypothetical protein
MMLGPVHFTFKSNTGESYSIVIDAATLDGNSLEKGDEIGVFNPAGLCVGASVWDGTSPLALTAWADDSQTTEVDGYKTGETMYFRIWDASASTVNDYTAIPTYSTGNGNFGDGVFAHISLLAGLTSATQILSLGQGWSWISFNVQPQDLAMDKVMAGLTELAIAINGAGEFYIPNVINSIGQMNVLHGYKVYVSSAAELALAGTPVEKSTPIALGAGWNFVSYLPGTPMPVETALASVLSQLAIVKNDEGKFYIPNVINSLGDMRPGEGYKLYLNADMTLSYPQGSVLAKQAKQTTVTKSPKPVHFSFKEQTGDNCCVLIRSLKANGQQPDIGDEVGVFTPDGLCVGAAVWDGSGPLGMAAWADDERTSEIDGFRDQQDFLFRFWDMSEDKEFALDATITLGTGNFLNDPFTAVELESVEIPSTYSLVQNYPNPFNAGTTIPYQLPEDGKVTLMIFNLLGEKVRTLVNENKVAGSYSIHWDGRNEFGSNVPSGIYVYRLRANSFVAVKKAVFVK